MQSLLVASPLPPLPALPVLKLKIVETTQANSCACSPFLLRDSDSSNRAYFSRGVYPPPPAYSFPHFLPHFCEKENFVSFFKAAAFDQCQHKLNNKITYELNVVTVVVVVAVPVLVVEAVVIVFQLLLLLLFCYSCCCNEIRQQIANAAFVCCCKLFMGKNSLRKLDRNNVFYVCVCA